jgi:hypothetical protein
MGYSGAGGKLIHEKNQKQKSRDTVPLKYIEKKEKKVMKKTEVYWRNGESLW